MRYLAIKKDMFLTEHTVVTEKTNTVKELEEVNHIWIYDRSGSMWYTLSDLIEDLIERSKQIPLGHTITLGWFSSEGKYNFILKGFKISNDTDYDILIKAIRNNSTTIGLTCFSEILKNTKQVIEDLSIISKNFSLMFMSDGYPVVSNYRKEIDSIYEAINLIEGNITSSLMVGYGNYYNKELMASMAERLGGSLAHCSDLKDFNVCLIDLLDSSKENSSKRKITLCPYMEKQLIFSINGKQINVYCDDEDTINFIPKKRNPNYVYTLTSEIPSGAIEVSLKGDISQSKDTLLKAAYAAAFLLTQKTKTDKALEILGILGDKALIDKVSNSFTPKEYGNTERDLKNAVFFTKRRFSEGRNINYLPKEDAFCLLDVLELLMTDSDGYFYPYHKDFKYNKVTIPTKAVEGYPKFKAGENTKCFLGDFSWNSTLLNLSLLANIKGSIDLGKDALKVSLPEIYNTNIFRNYTIVKDGYLNTPTLPVTLSFESFHKLQQEGLIEQEESWKKDRVILLHLNKVPVINRAIAKGKTSAKDLCKKSLEEQSLKAQVKVLKAIKKELQPSEVKFDNNLTDEQFQFLTEKGVTKNGFNPPTIKEDATDYYYAKEFKIKIKGLSSLPQVKAVRAKIAADKKLTTSALLIKEGLDLWEKEKPLTNNLKEQIKKIDSILVDLKHKMLRVRREIQEIKFAILLGKKWFDEFDNREESTLEVENVSFNIEVTEKQISI